MTTSLRTGKQKLQIVKTKDKQSALMLPPIRDDLTVIKLV